MCAFLDTRLTPSRRKYLSIFRGSFKTTVLLGFCIWLFVWAEVTGNTISICYNTGTKDNAEAFMEDFRETLINCTLLHWIFPSFPKTKDSYRRWTMKKVETRVAKFHVASLDTKQVSRHYTVIVNDDLVNDLNAYSERERETVIRQWKFQKSILTRYSKFKVGLELDTGTPFHSRDLISYIRTKVETYDKFIVPWAIEDGRGKVDPFRKNGVLTFPEMFDWEDFQVKKEDQGSSIFSTQYGLEVLEESDVLCKPEWIRHWSALPEEYKRVMIIDPAGVEKKSSSASGFNISDIDPVGNIYVVYSGKYWVTPSDLIRKMDEMRLSYRPDEIYIEKEKYSTTIADTMQHLAPKLNFGYVEHHGVSKAPRIYRMKQWLETGRIMFGPNMKPLEDRLLSYQGEDTDTDELDPLAYQVQILEPPKRGGRIRSQESDMVDQFEKEMNDLKKKLNTGGSRHVQF